MALATQLEDEAPVGEFLLTSSEGYVSDDDLVQFEGKAGVDVGGLTNLEAHRRFAETLRDWPNMRLVLGAKIVEFFGLPKNTYRTDELEGWLAVKIKNLENGVNK